MIKAIKDFTANCVRGASFYAHHTMPRFLHPIAIPIMAVTVSPVMMGIIAFNDARYFAKNRAIARAHSEIGPIETNIREIFGATSIEGMQLAEVSIEMNFDEAQIVLVRPDGVGINLQNRGMSSFGTRREEAVQELVGNFARAAAKVDVPDDNASEYYIAVRKAGALRSVFYEAEQIFSFEQAADPDAIISASHKHHWDDEDTRTHYVIRPVDAETHQKLTDLGF